MIPYNFIICYNTWMRYTWNTYILTGVFLTVLALLVAWIGYPLVQARTITITSPLPSFLTMQKNNQVATLDLWFPKGEVLAGNTVVEPNISAKAAFVYDLTSEKTLFAKNEKEKLPMASLTKIMTAIIALENKKADDRYVVFKKDLVGENSMGLTASEVLSQEELLYGLMLVSGNDAAEVLANNYTFGRDGFIMAMNNKAKAMGLLDTHFTNPSGLEGDGNQYTTAYDLLTISKYAVERFLLFRTVVATFQHTIPYTSLHKAFFLENETNLLTSYPGVKGVKTGYTPEAGLCLVTYLDYGGHRIIGVLLGSGNRRGEMKELLDYSLRSLGIEPPPHG